MEGLLTACTLFQKAIVLLSSEVFEASREAANDDIFEIRSYAGNLLVY